MSLENNTNESNYDENSLAEKFLKNLSDIDNSEENKNNLLMLRFRIDNMIYLIKRGLNLLNIDIPVECALDIGCSDGNISQIIIKENLAKNVIGIDKSKQMIEYAKLKCQNDQFKYIVMDANQDLKIYFQKQFSLITQTYMLCHAENVNQLFEIISNIFQISNGIFVGLLPSPFYDQLNNDKHLLKYRMNKICHQQIDGEKSYFTIGIGTKNEITLIDHWYNPDTYEQLFKKAGFKYFQWIPTIIDQNRMNKQEQDYLADFLNSGASIGFIAARNI